MPLSVISWKFVVKRLYGVYLLSMAFVLTIIMMVPSPFTVDNMWTVANDLITGLYSRVVKISMVLTGLMSVVAVISAGLSNDQHKVDQMWNWLQRIWIVWVAINGIGASTAYIAPKFSGLATLTP